MFSLTKVGVVTGLYYVVTQSILTCVQNKENVS